MRNACLQTVAVGLLPILLLSADKFVSGERYVDISGKVRSVIGNVVSNELGEGYCENERNNFVSAYFSEQDLEIIDFTARRVGVDSAYLMAIRMAENGGGGLEFGIIPTDKYKKDAGIVENGTTVRPYRNEYEKQASWCAHTVKKNLERFCNSDFDGDFIKFLQKRYCSIDAENDPNGLNRNWEGNVRFYYEKFKN
jgi:hypothetical protein